MSKDRLIEALETALSELRKPTITFTPQKQEPLSDKVVYIVQETSSDDVEFVFNTRKEAVEYVKQFDGVGSGYSFRIMEGIVWRREKDER